jgi:hypothetical protein
VAQRLHLDQPQRLVVLQPLDLASEILKRFSNKFKQQPALLVCLDLAALLVLQTLVEVPSVKLHQAHLDSAEDSQLVALVEDSQPVVLADSVELLHNQQRSRLSLEIQRCGHLENKLLGRIIHTD